MRFRLGALRGGRWPLLCGIAIGVLVAFPLAAPLMGGKILEPVATLWGSALGAIAAVSGALWVAERQASQQRKNATALVRAMLHPVAFHLEELKDRYGPASQPHPPENDEEPYVLAPEDWSKILSLAETVIERHIEFERKIHRVEAALNLLGPTEMEVFFELEAELKSAISVAVRPLRQRASEPGLRMYSGHASWSIRFALGIFNKHVQAGLYLLEQASK
jgi:hypothetical protein